MDSNPGQLTQSIFFRSLVQRRSSRPTKFYITRVLDTLNDGVPFSSSLCTITPVKSDRKTKISVTQDVDPNHAFLAKRVADLGTKIVTWLTHNQAFATFFSNCDNPKFVLKQDVWNNEYTLKINFSNVKHCKCRQRKTGNADHKTNSIYFVVYLSSGSIHQMCASNTCVTDGKRDVFVSPVSLPQYVSNQFQELLGPLAFDECLFEDEI